MATSGDDGPNLNEVFAPFSDAERRVLERFLRKIDALKASSFAQTESALRATPLPGVTAAGGPAWKVGVEGPSEESVKAAVVDFRQFHTDQNLSSAARVLNVLKASAKRRGTDAGQRMTGRLRDLGKSLEERARRDPRATVLDERYGEMSPREIIDLWLNGEYFHDDAEKAAEVSPDGGAAVEFLRWSLHSAIRDYIAYWKGIGELVSVVLKHPGL